MRVHGVNVVSHVPDSEAHPYPILFVHGAWHGAWCWEPNFLPYFAEQGFAVYALDLRGHGHTLNDKTMAQTGVWDYVHDVSTVAAHIQRVHGHHPIIVGHSMGGYVTQKLMERYIVPGAVLLASIPAVGTLPLLVRLTRDYFLTTLSALLLLHPYQYVKQVERAQTLFFSADMPHEQVIEYQSNMVNESMLILIQSGLIARPRPDATITAPVLVLGAEHDAIFTVDEVQATAHAYGTTATIFPEMAHDMMLEARWQEAADAIIEWIKRTF